jgi:hypothetical protein
MGQLQESLRQKLDVAKTKVDRAASGINNSIGSIENPDRQNIANLQAAKEEAKITKEPVAININGDPYEVSADGYGVMFDR